MIVNCGNALPAMQVIVSAFVMTGAEPSVTFGEYVPPVNPKPGLYG